MSPDPYVNKLLDKEFPCTDKSLVAGRINCILQARAEQRGLELCPYPSRAVLQHEIHELILTAEEAGPGKRVDRIAYLGYFEVLEGGVLWVGDRVEVDCQVVGRLAGYDLTHFPNHMNIIIQAQAPLRTGFESGYKPGAAITFTLPEDRRK
jgi:hypothetical protein